MTTKDTQFFKYIYKHYHIQLNKNQKEAVTHYKNPGLTLAIPGSGKTTLLLCRILYLNKVKNVPFQNILTLTFSKASANDMEKRFKKLFTKKHPSLHFSTIHRFAYKIVRLYYKKRQVNFTLIEGKKSYIKIKILKRLYQELNHTTIPDEELDQLTNDIGYCNNMMLKDNFPSKIKNFDKIYKHYKEVKKKNKYIDFDDMLLIALRILEKHPQILDFYASTYQFIQVDEAQDTSILQNKIIKILSQKHNNVFMVADDDQSIYGFRGAYPKYLLEFESHYDNASLYYLNKNYRSSYEIVDACTHFIKTNDDRYDKSIDNSNTKGNKPKIIEFKNNIKRNTYLLNELNATKNSCSILYRNSIFALPLINLLEKEDLSFNIRGKNLNMLRHWIVRDIRNFFKFILVDNDINAFESFYYKLNRYISKEMIAYLKSNARGRSVFDTLLKKPDLKKFQLKTIRELRDTFENLKTQSPFEIINAIKYDLNYLNYLDDFSNKTKNSYSNLKAKLNILENISSREKTPYDFLERLETLDHFIANHSNDSFNDITLSTLHSSKGLEFHTVFLIDIYDDILPQSKETLEEDRRLFYVGLSRAEKRLEILHSKFIAGRYNNKIQFIDQLKTLPSIKYTAKTDDASHDFNVGDIITHAIFGLGEIVSMDGFHFSIKFKDSLKKLSKDICLKNNLLLKKD